MSTAAATAASATSAPTMRHAREILDSRAPPDRHRRQRGAHERGQTRDGTRAPFLPPGQPADEKRRVKAQRGRDAQRGAADDVAPGGERPDEQREQREHELIDLPEPHRVFERLAREEHRRQRQRRHQAQPCRTRDPEERGNEQSEAQGHPCGDSVAPCEKAERHERQHGEGRIREGVDVHEPVVRVQRAETARLLDQRRIPVHALDAIHAGVVKRRARPMEMRARVEDGEVTDVAQARGLHRAHDETAAEHRHHQNQRHDDGRHARAHLAASRTRA